MTFCPQCGRSVAATDSFCTACGSDVVHAAGAVAPATPPQRPPGVGIIGSTMVLLGAILLLLFTGSIYVLATDPASRSDVVAQLSARSELEGIDVLPILYVIAAIGSLLAATAIVAGIGALRARRWAWRLMILFMALNALVAILMLPAPVGFVGILVSAIVIWYFRRPEVRAYFGRA